MNQDIVKYWFLESAVHHAIGLSWIIPDEIGEIGINMYPLDLKIDEIAVLMEELFQEGKLSAVRSGDLYDFQFSENNEYRKFEHLLKVGVVPSVQEIITELKPPEQSGIYFSDNLYYFLTPLGVRDWESFSKPNWKSCLSTSQCREKLENIDVFSIDIFSMEQEIIQKYINLYPLINYNSLDYYTDRIDNLEITEWSYLSSFRYSYWKIWESTHKVTCKIISEKISVDRDRNEVLSEQRKKARDWYRQTSKWYKSVNDLIAG
jgi:hypothetical protein